MIFAEQSKIKLLFVWKQIRKIKLKAFLGKNEFITSAASIDLTFEAQIPHFIRDAIFAKYNGFYDTGSGNFSRWLF